MNDHEAERRLRDWLTRETALPAPPDLRRRILSIPASTPAPLAGRLAAAIGWRPAPLPRLGIVLLVAALTIALVAATAYVGSRLLDSRPGPPRVPPAVEASSRPGPTPTPTATPTPPATPLAAACGVLDDYVAASEELRAIDPWNRRDTTFGELLAAYERFRVASITATDTAGESLASVLMHELPNTVEELGAAIASLDATTPADAEIPIGQLGEIHEILLRLAAAPPAGRWPCDPDIGEIPRIVMTSNPAGCSPVTSAIETTSDGWTITASRDGRAWLRVAISDVAFRTRYGRGAAVSIPAPGWVFLEVRVAYEALVDGAYLSSRSLPLAEFDEQPDGAVAVEVSNPAGAPARPVMDRPLRGGEAVEGLLVYEVPATGRVGLTGQWLLRESPAPAWRYWTLPFPGGSRYCIYQDSGGVTVRTR